MENLLLLTAALLSISCALLSLFCRAKYLKKIILILWSLSTAFVIAAFTRMVFHLISSDFEYQYVYSHSSLDTGLIYKISALWSGQEGSFLLWAAILGIMGFFALKFKGSLKSFGIYASVSSFLFLMCFFTKPFAKMTVTGTDGLGLNEALKDPWMILHPPLVFISYSAMAILFSCSAARKEAGYADRVLIWQRISWFFLGAGILSGSIWAYRALGWGGYWAWDPIENAALVPWLILCGFIHDKESGGRSACLVPFSVACFGVFLARSGILADQSAHAYTSGNTLISIIIISFLAAVFFFLIITRILKSNSKNMRPMRRKTVGRMIIYSIYGYAALILFGTICPLLFHIAMPIKFYNISSIAFSIAYCILLLINDFTLLKRRSPAIMLTATVLTVGIILLIRSPRLGWLLLIWICLLPVSLWLVSGFRQRRLTYYLSHFGVILLIIGSIGSSVLGKEAFLVVASDSTKVMAEGVEISAKELTEKGMIIKTMPLKDILLKNSERVLSPQGLIIPYETKPVILLFWSGSFIVIFQPCVALLLNRKKKEKKQIA